MERFAITHFDPKTGLRQLTFANQARQMYDTREDAQKALVAYAPDLRAKILGDRANTLEVRSVDCYENGDAKGIYFPIRFHVVTGRPFIIFCFSCGKKQWAGDVDGQLPVYADETGVPFKAYYCSECASAAIQIQGVQS